MLMSDDGSWDGPKVKVREEWHSLALLLEEQQDRIEWLEDLVRDLIGTPNVHDTNYQRVKALLHRWPYDPNKRQEGK